ncbi:Cytochrome P450 [Corchorus olitorius]|uniref:Cytochrome P450 n=1 Tax=Corchorus olitorius TaxID=93759 RepID=A0A1R3JBF8_9ROSI|nr:Cytochrome P450 [Corchorus olitorius]
MSSSSSSSSSTSLPPELPLKPVPGDWGHRFFGPIRDRLAYFYNEGRDDFFSNRVQKYKSTVFKTNMPPGPFISSSPRVICLLDAVSFTVLFDTSKVEKRDVLDGTYLPSLDYTGGHRVCAYLDPSEQKHSSLKYLFMTTLATRHNKFIPLFQTCLSQLFNDLESEISTKKKASFNTLSDTMSFNYVFRLLCDNKDPTETKLGSKGPKLVDKWLLFQLAPIGSLGVLPSVLGFLEDVMLRTFTFPFFLVKSDYQKLYDAFHEFGGSILDEAEKLGIDRDEACHNLVFLAGFNAYGGMKVLFPGLIKWVALAGEKLHKKLAEEIRSVVKAEGGVTFSALEKMALTKSVVYEFLRIDPPVPFQYGKAKTNLVVQSHDAAFEIKKGEMLFGYQTFATKDPKVFENPEEFVADRFVGEGEKLLKYVYWSNGRETEDVAAENKTCPGKNLVVLLCRILLVELFLRYDTFEVDATVFMFAASVTFKSLTKASNT